MDSGAERMDTKTILTTLLACLWCLSAASSASDATADYIKYPEILQPYVIQFTTANVPPAERQKVADILAFVCASFSRQQIIEYCVPQRHATLPDTYFIQLDKLKWSNYDWNRFVAQVYPYGYYSGDKRYSASDTNRHYYPERSNKTYKADWFISYITDANNSSAGYALLYGSEQIPKNRSDFLKFWEVNTKAEHAFGLIESSSRVSKRNLRWLENYSRPRGYVWGTKDFLNIDPTKSTDPFTYPIPNDSRQKHDGEEWIVGVPKISSTSGERGALQVYMLFDGQGKRIDKADGDLVEDHTRYKGFSQIRTSGSCIQCHTSGLNGPTHNAIKELILSGGDIYASYQGKEALELFHLSDSAKEIKRANEDYATAVFEITLTSPELNAKVFKQIVDKYVARVDIQTAARDLYTTPENLRLAFAYESNTNKSLSPYIVQLAQGQSINRETWEAIYLSAKQYLDKYNALQNAK